MNLCSKPGCARPGAAVLAYDYSASTAKIEDPPGGELSPHVYALCALCAEKLRPPQGWSLEDHRSSPPLFLDEPIELAPATRTADSEEADEPEKSARQVFFGYSA